MTKNTVIWLRYDLRLSDNCALDYAHKNNHKIIFLFVLDENHSIGSASKWFLHKALNAFEQDISNKYNAKLIIKSGDTKLILEDLIHKYQINSILWNRVYEPEAMELSADVKKYFNEKKLETKSFNSSLFF